MRNFHKLAMISLIALSSCANKIITVPGAQIDAKNQLIDYRDFTFNNKNKTMTSKRTSTEPPSLKLHGWVCVSPETFNLGFTEWKKAECN